MKILSIFLILSLVALSYCDLWAVFVAGSNGYDNYRHQADVCHAYTSFVKRGVDPNHLILFSYDDVASSSENPFPNQLYNKPCPKAPCTDVNKGCVVDYKGSLVTPKNYLYVITGNATAMQGKGSGRVLQSTSNDYVFLNFADHGASGLIAFPSQYLYATDLQNALKQMAQQKMFKELVYYMEACESGSMFVGFPTNLKIYAVTAANPTESSWGCYCPPDDVVMGKEIGSCLGDLFSVNWMEDMDKANCSETLEQQYQIVKQLTTLSHVTQYGDLSFVNDSICNFEGGSTENNKQDLFYFPLRKYNVMESKKIKLEYLRRRWESDKNNKAYKLEYENEILTNKLILSVMRQVAEWAGVAHAFDYKEYPEITQWDCYKDLVQTFEDECMKFTEYTLEYVRIFVHMCEDPRNYDRKALLRKVIDKTCKKI